MVDLSLGQLSSQPSFPIWHDNLLVPFSHWLSTARSTSQGLLEMKPAPTTPSFQEEAWAHSDTFITKGLI